MCRALSHQSASGREYRAVDVHLGHGLRLQVSPGQTDAGNVDSVILHAFSSAQSGPRVINNQPSSYIEHSDASLSKETEEASFFEVHAPQVPKY